jgi:uncharacterized repeat protein (TIGR03803 family)
MTTQYQLRISKMRQAKLAAASFAVVVLLVALIPTAHAQTYSVLYNFKSGPAGIVPFDGLTLDSKGNLYGTTGGDGALASGTVFKLDPHGKYDVLYNFTGRRGDGQSPFIGTLTRDHAGNLYGTTINGGIYSQFCIPGCGTVYKVDSRGKETILHIFTGTGGDGSQPYGGVILDSTGNIYGATTGGGTSGGGIVFKLDSHGKETILYNFTGGSDGSAPIGTLVSDNNGNFYGTAGTGGADGYGTVFKIDTTGKYTLLYTFTGAGDGGFSESPLVLDPAGNLYGTTDLGGTSGFGNVFKLDTKGTETALYSFTGGADGGTPSYAGLVRDAAGNLYGAASSGGTASGFGVVFKIDTTGKETVLHRFKGSDGRIPDGSVTLDSHGSLYGTTTLGGAYNGGVVYKISQ